MATTAPRSPVPLAARVPALDGLRGVAILGVLAFHTGHLAGGFLGVDLFFALSGYLITALLLRELQATGGVSVGAFWGRRLRRLFPALATTLVVVTVVVWSVGAVRRLGQRRLGPGRPASGAADAWPDCPQGRLRAGPSCGEVGT